MSWIEDMSVEELVGWTVSVHWCVSVLHIANSVVCWYVHYKDKQWLEEWKTRRINSSLVLSANIPSSAVMSNHFAL